VKILYKRKVWGIAAALLFFVSAACAPPQSVQEPQSNTSTEQVAEPTQIPATVPAEVVQTGLPEVNESSSEPYTLEGALTTDSGLQYLELTAGTGRTPDSGDIVTMHFAGSLTNGTEFANSKTNGEPVTVVLGRQQLLEGWEEGLALMKVGGVSQMVLPPELAFGEQQYGMIPPNSQIILEVELLTAEKPPQPTTVLEDDLITTESGLQYSDLTKGEGLEVAQDNFVTTHFTIWVQGEDTNEFILRSEGSEPISFVVGRGDTVFPGWEEGMLTMQVGGIRQMIVPPELALGDTGGNGIPPGATLVMEVELIDLREPVVMTEVDEEDYVTTERGLKYYDIVEGDGESPEEGQTVSVHYTGWLENGQQFDSSVDRGTPFSFALGTGSVIQGWDEGVATMKVGGKRQLVIPPELGYGETGSGGTIPPGATLIFDVELLEIQP
jgi:peptidylprolyl isomerase